MNPTVGSVVRLGQLRLRLLAGEDHLDARVRWVAVSELEDPASYLEGGEIVLTTGITLAGRSAAALDAYVQRLSRSGVVALGIGLGITLDAVPAALVTAARRHALPVFEVPEPTPFIAISKAVADLLTAEEREETRRLLQSQRDLTRAALRPDAQSAVLRQLVRTCGGGALLVDQGGELVEASPPAMASRAAEFEGELARLRRPGVSGSGALHSAGERTEIHPLGRRGRPKAHLIVLLPSHAGRVERAAVAVAVSLLAVILERHGQSAVLERRMVQTALDLLLRGDEGAHAPVMLAALGHVLPEGLVVAVLAPAGSAESLLDDLRSDRSLDRQSTIAGVAAGQVVVVSGDDAATRAQLRRLATELNAVTGISRSASARDLPRAYREAVGAQTLSQRDRVPVTDLTERAASGLFGLVEHGDGEDYARAKLAPLHAYAHASGIDLVDTLRAYLAANGQWENAAAVLRVHRNTLRYRIRKIIDLLGVDLDSPDARMDLWFALAFAPSTD